MGDLMGGRPLIHLTQTSGRDKARAAEGGRGGATVSTQDHEILDEARDAVRLSQHPQACPCFPECVRLVHKATVNGGENKGQDVAHRQILGTRGQGAEKDVATPLTLRPLLEDPA
jgi:hypothetical protein